MDPEWLAAALEALRAMRPAFGRGRRRGLPRVIVMGDDHAPLGEVRGHTRAGRDEMRAELGLSDPLEMAAKESATIDKREYEDAHGIDSDELTPRRGETYPGQYYRRRR